MSASGSGVHVLDPFYLAITLLITLAYQLFFFAIAWSFKFDKVTDFAGGTNFVVLAVVTLALSSGNGSPNARQVVDSLFIMLWGARLSAFLLFRILKTGKDDRFDDKRDQFCLPVTVLNSPEVRQWTQQSSFGQATDILGVVGFGVGFVMESLSDVQKYRFRSTHKQPGALCDRGLFRWSRHPNYFGEILIQFSIYLIAITPCAYGHIGSRALAALIASIVGPLFLTVLLLFVSGLPLQERPGAKKRFEKGQGWPEYRDYLDRTSILIPLPPWLYRRVPVWLKRTVLLEWPIYVFDPVRHAGVEEGGLGERGGGGEGGQGSS
ncbi:hypothetical protein M8818_000850 [Zalaria obscura]|uniref:Uncharacterized protein n=1 Tax=Zalaria obscura TaxID=2024903 RepID=A0ACC3SMF8_9PEZI